MQNCIRRNANYHLYTTKPGIYFKLILIKACIILIWASFVGLVYCCCLLVASSRSSSCCNQSYIINKVNKLGRGADTILLQSVRQFIWLLMFFSGRGKGGVILDIILVLWTDLSIQVKFLVFFIWSNAMFLFYIFIKKNILLLTLVYIRCINTGR